MARSTTHSFTCPCGMEFTYQQYEYVNVGTDPQLRYQVLAGLLNVAICPNCGRRAAFSTPFIYSDPAYGILAYVHPREDLPDEARLLIIEQLRSTYKSIASSQASDVPAQKPEEALATTDEMPPLKVFFGLDKLQDILSGVLSPEDRLGRLALNTQSRNEAERGQFLDITRKLATQMGCLIEVEDLPDEYTVWLYGSRRQINVLMQALAPRG